MPFQSRRISRSAPLLSRLLTERPGTDSDLQPPPRRPVRGRAPARPLPPLHRGAQGELGRGGGPCLLPPVQRPASGSPCAPLAVTARPHHVPSGHQSPPSSLPRTPGALPGARHGVHDRLPHAGHAQRGPLLSDPEPRRREGSWQWGRQDGVQKGFPEGQGLVWVGPTPLHPHVTALPSDHPQTPYPTPPGPLELPSPFLFFH